MHKRNDFGNGFTIIELIIVIVVIAILTTIVAVAYSGITRNAHISVLKSELASAQRQLQLDFAKNSETYPDSLEDSNDGRGLQFNDKATLVYTAHNDEEPKRYCLTATIDTLTYYVVPSQAPQEGFCPEHNPNIAPDAPSISTTVDSQTQITVSWEAVGDPLTDDENQIAASYRLEYSTSADFTSFSTINNITNTSREVTGLSAGTTYYFRVYSINSNGSASAPSTVVSDETQQLPPAGAPTVTCTTNSATQITVNWTTVSGATSYTLEQSTASNFSPVTTIPDLTGSSTARTALNQGIRYYFRVSSTGPGGVGPTSSAVNCTTTINAPDSPTVTVTIPGGSRAASSGPWAKTSDGLPTSGTYYYAQGVVSSSTCPAGTSREARARIQYNGGGAWGAWTSYQSASTFYAINPSSPWAIKFQVTTRCKTSFATSSASSSGQGCRKSGNVAIACW